MRERCEQRLGAWSGDGRAEFIEQFAGPLPLLVNVDPLELDPGRPDDYTTLATRPRPWAATSAPSALLSGRLAENIRLSLQF